MVLKVAQIFYGYFEIHYLQVKATVPSFWTTTSTTGCTDVSQNS